jgi:hypothetical protein
MGYIIVNDKGYQCESFTGTAHVDTILNDISSNHYTNKHRLECIKVFGELKETAIPFLPQLIKIQQFTLGLPAELAGELDSVIKNICGTKNKIRRIIRASLMEVKDDDF